jgi:membrane dipeptidase
MSTEAPRPPDPLDALGVSAAAVDLVRHSDLIDLHIDTFIPPRLWGYDVFQRHDLGLLRGHFFGHLDVPRMFEAGLTGAMWSITTNPFRTKASRLRVFRRNLQRFQAMVEASQGRLRFARDVAEYRAVRAAGAQAVLLSVQGGNALEAAPAGPAEVPDRLLTRVTLVHLTSSGFGETNSPFAWFHPARGLSEAGRAFIAQLDAARIFVDLAHIAPRAFDAAVAAHDRSLPLIATHTGVDGVRPHWRNLSDAHIRAIADSGGVVGIIFAAQFLSRRGGPRDVGMVVEHLLHVLKVGGEDCPAIGTDYDGAISPPGDLRDGTSYVRLVQALLDRGLSERVIVKMLGENFLNSFERLRPVSAAGTPRAG